MVMRCTTKGNASDYLSINSIGHAGVFYYRFIGSGDLAHHVDPNDWCKGKGIET